MDSFFIRDTQELLYFFSFSLNPSSLDKLAVRFIRYFINMILESGSFRIHTGSGEMSRSIVIHWAVLREYIQQIKRTISLLLSIRLSELACRISVWGLNISKRGTYLIYSFSIYYKIL